MKLKELIPLFENLDNVYIQGINFGTGHYLLKDLSFNKYKNVEVISIETYERVNSILIKVKPQFNESKWIKNLVEEYNKEKNLRYLIEDDTTLVLNLKRPQKIGWSVCRDRFSTEKGIAIAYARYKGLEIPKELY